MYVDKSVFESENDKKEEDTGNVKKIKHHKEELNILTNKMQDIELGVNKEIIQEKKFL